MRNDAIFNSLVTSQRALPWLQETSEANVWGRWDVTWRDVRIVDAQGRLQAVYNLTSHDLGNAQNRATLKELFLNTAKILDSDRDQLPDDWEMLHFGNLTASPAADSDRDGDDNFREFAFGTNPLDPKSRPLIAAKIAAGVQRSVLNLTLRRRSGAFLDYSIVELNDLNVSPASAAELSPADQLRNLFDGTGTVEGTYSVSASAPHKFIKVRAIPRQQGSTPGEPDGPVR
ncbi:MAG: hypothetical protein L0Z50_31155 [Verrucomicrobiales bacterium]|nr:hypothetical protein [Verrucomicrobiales bacterium]